MTHPESDYDICWVLTDESHTRYAASDEWPERGRGLVLSVKLDIWQECPRNLTRETVIPWMLPAYAESAVLLDKTGAITPLLANLSRIPEEQGLADIPAWYDAYLYALYRSLKAWRRGNALGGRLQAAEMRSRGYASVVDAWEGEIAKVCAWDFGA